MLEAGLNHPAFKVWLNSLRYIPSPYNVIPYLTCNELIQLIGATYV